MDEIVWRQQVFGKCLKCGKTGYSMHIVYNTWVNGKLEELTRCLSCNATNQFEPIIRDEADATHFKPIRTYDDYYRRSKFGVDFEQRGKTGKSKR
jgi:hypothetical protein